MTKLLDIITGKRHKEEMESFAEAIEFLNAELYEKLQWIYDELGMPYSANSINGIDINLEIFIEIIKRIKALENSKRKRWMKK